MNILLDKLPEHVEINDKMVAINSDFRTSIRFELLIQDETILSDQKVAKALKLYYPVIPNDIKSAIEQMLWFYRCGKKEKKLEMGVGGGQPAYSFSIDDSYFYAAFLDQYGIDLNTAEDLHWWKFKALFDGLKPDNRIVEIMGYRTMYLSKDMSGEQRRFYQEMKRIYGLGTIGYAEDVSTYERRMKKYVDYRFQQIKG